MDSLLQSFDRSAFVKRLAQEFSVGGVAPADIALGLTVVDSADPAVLEPLLPSASRRRLASGYLLVSIAIRIPAAATGDEVDSIVGVADHLLQTPSYASSALGVVTVAVPARPSVIRVVGLAVDATASALAAAAGVGGLVGSGSDLFGLPDAAAVIAWDAISAEQAATAQTAVSVAVGLGVGAAVLGVATASVSSVLATATGGLPVGSTSSSALASLVPLVFGFQRLAMRAGVPSTSDDDHTSRAGLTGAVSAPLRGLLGYSGLWNAMVRLVYGTNPAVTPAARRELTLAGTPSGSVLSVGAAGRAIGGDLRAGGAAGGGRLLAAADAAEGGASALAAAAVADLLSPRGLPEPFAPLVDLLVTSGVALVLTFLLHIVALLVWRSCMLRESDGDDEGEHGASPRHAKEGGDDGGKQAADASPKEPSTHRRIVRRARHAALPVSLVSLSPEIAVVLYFTGGLGEAAITVLAHAVRVASSASSSSTASAATSSSSAAAGVLPYPIAYAIASVVILFLLAVFTLASVIAVRRFHRQYAPELWLVSGSPDAARQVDDPVMRALSRVGMWTGLLRAPIARTRGGFERPGATDGSSAPDDCEPRRTARLLRTSPLVGRRLCSLRCRAPPAAPPATLPPTEGRAVGGTATTGGRAGDALEALSLLLESGRGDGADRVLLQPMRLLHQLLVAAILASSPSAEAYGPAQLVPLLLLQLSLALWMLGRRPSADLLAGFVEGSGLLLEAISTALLLAAYAATGGRGSGGTSAQALAAASAYALLLGTVGLPSALSCYDESLGVIGLLRSLRLQTYPSSGRRHAEVPTATSGHEQLAPNHDDQAAVAASESV